MTTAHPLVRRAAIVALLGCAFALALSWSSVHAQSSSVGIINTLSSQGYYISPTADQEMKGANSPITDADSKIKNAVNNLKGKGYDVKIGMIVSSDIPQQYGNLANYCQYLHDYLNMGNGILVMTAIDGGAEAASTKLSPTDTTTIFNSKRADFTKNVVDGTVAFATAVDDKILGNDSGQRNSFITIAAIVIIVILAIAFFTISGLNARWAMRLNGAKKLSSDLSAEVVQMGGNLDFLKMQNAQAYDQVTAQLNPGNQLLSEANTQLGQLKSPGFFPLAFRYSKLDHDMHDVEAALQSAKGEIDQAKQIFDANWSSRNAKVAGQP